jgi:hypothetical protein
MIYFLHAYNKIKLCKLARQILRLFSIGLLIVSTGFFGFNSASAIAGINDDRYEGNIFILYAGNGSLIPPRVTLKQSLARKTPAILVYYVDDSSDCKQYSLVVSRLQEFYGRAANIIPISIDSLALKAKYSLEKPGYYYQGKVPQTVILNQQGKIVFDRQGQAKYEEMDDVLRAVFDLLPRTESVQLKRRSFNEYNAEITD